MEFSIESAWLVAGILTAIITGGLKRFGWLPDERIIKQLTALVVAGVLVVLFPVLQGQALPGVGALVLAIVQTWLTAMASYSVYNTAANLNIVEPEIN